MVEASCGDPVGTTLGDRHLTADDDGQGGRSHAGGVANRLDDPLELPALARSVDPRHQLQRPVEPGPKPAASRS